MKARIQESQKLWHKNAASIFEKHTDIRDKYDHERIANIRALIQNSSHGKAILDWADTHSNVTILMDHQCEKAIGYYCTGANVIGLNSRYSDEELTNTLCHELRHCWQDHNDLIATTALTPQEQSFQTRFTEADAFAYGNIVYYELVQQKIISALPMSGIFRLSSASAITDARRQDPQALENGLAYAQAFKQFFRFIEPMATYDRHALQKTANDLGIIKYNTPNVTGEFIGIPSKRLFHFGMDLDQKNSISRLGNVFGKYNFISKITEDMGKGSIYQTFHAYAAKHLIPENKYFWAKLRHYTKANKQGLKLQKQVVNAQKLKHQ